MKDIVKGKLLVTLTSFGNTKNGGNQNFPNPFNPSTKISFTLKQAANVSLKVYDTSGRVVQTLSDGYMNSGTYSVTSDVTGRSRLSSGVYFYKLRAGEFQDTKKMMVVK